MKIIVMKQNAEVMIELTERDAVLLSHEILEIILQKKDNPEFLGWFNLPCKTNIDGVNSIGCRIVQ